MGMDYVLYLKEDTHYLCLLGRLLIVMGPITSSLLLLFGFYRGTNQPGYTIVLTIVLYCH